MKKNNPAQYVYLIRAFDFSGYNSPYESNIGVFYSEEEAKSFVNFHSSVGTIYSFYKINVLSIGKNQLKRMKKSNKEKQKLYDKFIEEERKLKQL